jgi:hypothetical protein
MSSRQEFTEEELRAIEAEMERLTADDVLLQTLVTLINLGARKLGLAEPPGQEPPKRDLEQTKISIDGARAILALVEPRHGEQLGQIRDALSRLQMAYVQLSGAKPAEPSPSEPEQGKPGEPGPAQKSGRLWVPGQ